MVRLSDPGMVPQQGKREVSCGPSASPSPVRPRPPRAELSSSALPRKHRDAIAPGFLGLIERAVRPAEQPAEVMAADARGRDADADRRRDRVPADLGRGVGERHADAFGERARGRLAFVRQQDGEFLAAEAARKIVRAEAAVQRRGKDRQHPVADRVAVDVVDRLEAIEIGDQHSDRLAARRAPGDRGLRVDHERAPVRRAR